MSRSGGRDCRSLTVTRNPAGGKVDVVKISSKSNPNSCAGALAGTVRSMGAVEVQVVGAGALNQAVKAIAIARGYLAGSGVDLVCVPSFADIEIGGEKRTAIRLLVEDRDGGSDRYRQPDVDVDVDVRDGTDSLRTPPVAQARAEEAVSPAVGL